MNGGRRTAAVIVGTLFFAPAGPLILGHYRRVVSSFAFELVAVAIAAVGALYNVPALLLLAVGLGLLNRAAMIRGAIRLPPQPNLPRGARLFLLIAALFCAENALPFTVRESLVEAFRIPSGSMVPTLQIDDHMFIDKRAVHPKRGDVIVFRYPREPDKDFIKRVIAVGGDTVTWNGEAPVVNGQPIARTAVSGDCGYVDYDEINSRWEPRKCRAFEESLDGRKWKVIQEPTESERTFAPVVVPRGSYYLLGDNRDNSHDSRYWGSVSADYVKGSAIGIWWSSDGRGFHSDRIGKRIN